MCNILHGRGTSLKENRGPGQPAMSVSPRSVVLYIENSSATFEALKEGHSVKVTGSVEYLWSLILHDGNAPCHPTLLTCEFLAKNNMH